MEKSFGGNWGQMWQRWSVLMTSDSLDDTHSTQYFLQNIYNNSFNPFYVEMARLTSVPLIKAAYIWLKQRIRSAWERLMTSTDTCVKRVWSCAKKAGDWSGLGGGEGWLVGQLHGGTESNGRLLFSVKARPACCCCCCTDKWDTHRRPAPHPSHPPLQLHQHSLQLETAVTHHNVWEIEFVKVEIQIWKVHFTSLVKARSKCTYFEWISVHVLWVESSLGLCWRDRQESPIFGAKKLGERESALILEPGCSHILGQAALIYWDRLGQTSDRWFRRIGEPKNYIYVCPNLTCSHWILMLKTITL